MARKPKKAYRPPVATPSTDSGPASPAAPLEPRPKRVKPAEKPSAKEIAAANKKAARARLLKGA